MGVLILAKGFYFKLASANLVRNRRMYVPYLIATVIMSAMYFIILNLVFSQSISNMSYGPVMQSMLSFGLVVMSVFVIGYMLYINSFLIKRRKKEFGLYGVLGLEKRHVARVIAWENILLNLPALALGILAGCLFGKLVLMLLLYVLRTAPDSTYELTGGAFITTILIFFAIFVLTTLYNLFQVRLANPVDLLQGEKKGEKKMRGMVPMTILGLLLLGTAYYVAITAESPTVSIALFWPAVIAVIIATWLLFTSGSVFVLNLLRKNKRFYYKPRNFIAVSSLIHRMKQNAAGLANICILSTMVMVTVSACCALFFGQEGILRKEYPDDLKLTYYGDTVAIREQAVDALMDRARSLAEEQNVEIDSLFSFESAGDMIIVQDGRMYFRDQNDQFPAGLDVENMEYYYTLNYISLADYNAATGSTESLAADEILLLTEADIGRPANLFDFRVQAVLGGSPFTMGPNGPYDSVIYAVVPDMEAALRLMQAVNPAHVEAETDVDRYFIRSMVLNISGEEADCLLYANQLYQSFNEINSQMADAAGYSYWNIFEARNDYYGLYGGLLFLGAFFTILFLTNTVLIIYFKQVSEGMDDRERFEILQKVGMDDREVKKTINRQILIVFFLPLVTALVHIAAATNMITRMLQVFQLYNTGLTFFCILITCLVFSLVYVLVYRFTARTYYKLVKW